MPIVKDALCRNPKCMTQTRVYIPEHSTLTLSGYYVFHCPKCGKQVPFPEGTRQKVEALPPDAIIAEALV